MINYSYAVYTVVINLSTVISSIYCNWCEFVFYNVTKLSEMQKICAFVDSWVN